MNMSLLDWIRNSPEGDGGWMELESGLRMSVKFSKFHYCSPRGGSVDDCTAVEIGFPSQTVPELMKYAENPDHPTETVYARVPVELVESVVDAHGGIVNEFFQNKFG